MIAEVEISGAVVDVDFWNQCLVGIGVLAVGAVAVLFGPGLLCRILTSSRRLPERTPTIDKGRLDAGAAPPPVAPDRTSEPAGRLPRVLKAARREAPPAASPASGGRGAERRKHLRRKGRATKIHVKVLPGQQEPLVCWVANRSRGGLGIVIDQPVPVGQRLQVRPADGAEEIPWVEVEVRNTRCKGKHWYLGCQFSKELPWSLILLFG